MSKDNDGTNQQRSKADSDSSPSLSCEMRTSVSFSSIVSLLEEDTKDSNTLAEGDDDLLPKSIFSGRWIGDISTSNDSRGVALVEINDTLLKLPFQHSEQLTDIRKRLSFGHFDTSKSITELEHKGRSLQSPPQNIDKNSCVPTFAFEGSSTGGSLEFPLNRIIVNNSKHSSPLTSPVSERNNLRLLNSGFLAQDANDCEVTTRMRTGSLGHSLDSGSTRKICDMWMGIVNCMRAVLIFVGYVAAVAWSPLRVNRLFWGLKVIGAFMLCCLSSVSATHRRSTELSEIVWSRKTFLLVIYIVAWSNVVNAAAGLWSARLAEKTSITGNEMTLPAWQKTSHEILARDLPRSTIDTNAVISDANEAADHEIDKISTPKVTRVSKSLVEEVAEVDVDEVADLEINETITPKVTRVSESLYEEEAEMDAVKVLDMDAVISDVNEAARHEIDETVTPDISHVSEYLDAEVTEVDMVELIDTDAVVSGVNEAADHEIYEKFTPKITRASESLDKKVAEVDAIELTDMDEVISGVHEAAGHEISETIVLNITRVSESIYEEVADVDVVKLTDTGAVINDVNEAADHAIDGTITPKITRVSESLNEEVKEATETQESIISLHFTKVIAIANEFDVDLITPETAHISEPKISPLIDEKDGLGDVGRYENLDANIKVVSPSSERESNVTSLGTEESAAADNNEEAETIAPETSHSSEPKISPLIVKKEVLVSEFTGATATEGTEEDSKTGYPASGTTDGEESTDVASLVAAETASESEARNVNVRNELDTDSADEIASSDTEDSNLDADETNIAKTDRISPASEGDGDSEYESASTDMKESSLYADEMNIAETDRIGPASEDEGSTEELEASHEARATLDQLPRRKRPPGSGTPFIPKSWTKDSTKKELTSRFTTYLFSVPTWKAPLLSMSGDGTAVNKHVHFVPVSAVSRLAKVAVGHCAAFLIGVDGKYKNQAMMDILSEVWTSRFFI